LPETTKLVETSNVSGLKRSETSKVNVAFTLTTCPRQSHPQPIHRIVYSQLILQNLGTLFSMVIGSEVEVFTCLLYFYIWLVFMVLLLLGFFVLFCFSPVVLSLEELILQEKATHHESPTYLPFMLFCKYTLCTH
jgi:hypothetical protein